MCLLLYTHMLVFFSCNFSLAARQGTAYVFAQYFFQPSLNQLPRNLLTSLLWDQTFNCRFFKKFSVWKALLGVHDNLSPPMA